jgi:hypothetical protein
VSARLVRKELEGFIFFNGVSWFLFRIDYFRALLLTAFDCF